MKKSLLFTWISIILVCCLWTYSLFNVPTFDLDESLYRRVAEEMKWSGDYWHARWDGVPFHHKPPFFYWIIIVISTILDGANAGVSILSARLPSLISTLGILTWIARYQKRTPEPLRTSLIHTLLTWSCMLFPLATSVAVIFDPLQTLALMPSLLIPHRAFSENRSLRTRELHWISISMFAATAIKGLTGLILPTLAIALHTVIREWNLKKTVKSGINFLVHAFLPAIGLSLALFAFLDLKIGREFTNEFFLIHHLGRGSTAMESHHGPIYYYPLILLFGGGLLIPLLAYYFSRVKFNYPRFGYSLSYVLAVVFFFSLSATKLPHYVWPAWPALALQFLVLIQLPAKTIATEDRPLWNAFSIPIMILGVAIFYFILNSDDFQRISLDDGSLFMLSAGATLCLFLPWVMNKFMKQPEYLAFFMALISALVVVPASIMAESSLVTPFELAVAELKKRNPLPTDKLRYAGPNSATLSLILNREIGRQYWHNRSEPMDYRYLMVIPSKKDECINDDHILIFENQNLILCERKQKGH